MLENIPWNKVGKYGMLVGGVAIGAVAPAVLRTGVICGMAGRSIFDGVTNMGKDTPAEQPDDNPEQPTEEPTEQPADNPEQSAS